MSLAPRFSGVTAQSRAIKTVITVFHLTWFCCVSAFGIDFSGPLQNVSVTVNSGLVSYNVVDPVFGTRSGSTNTPANYVSTPANSGGVVAWVASGTSGSTIHYRIYDPGRSNWMAGFSATAATSIIGPINDSGLVAWQAGTEVSYVVYDPISGTWNKSGLPLANYTFLQNSGGMIACLLGSTVYFVTYNPFSRTWPSGNLMTTGFIPGIQAGSGVVAWSAANTVYCSTYDFKLAAWRTTSAGGGGVINNLTIANSTVAWSSGTPSLNYTAGYNSTNGTWAAGATPVHASFLVSTASGNAPLFVWFTDLSLGGTAWSWNFGDGATAVGPTPYHVFNGLGRYPVVQTVAGTGGTLSTAGTNILTDLIPPAGTIVINNDDSYTRSTNVTLTLSVTDNSGTVSYMRFSNAYATNSTIWSPWYPYASSFAWSLSTGDGLKSVYAQFSDPASNLLTISDSITLDSRPPPVAFVSDYSIPESAASLQVMVQLSYSTFVPVSVDYATSDGTATAGSDYAGTSGRLKFNPGQTSLSFNLFLTNDTLVELNETLFITLSNPTNATVGPPATVTILDDDPPTVSFATNTFRVDENGVQALITASLNAPSGLTLSVNYASSNGTATAGSDYTAVSGLLVFTPGQLTRSFGIPIMDDSIDEPDETVRLFLSNPTNAVLGAQSSATLIIVDDDYPPVSFSTNQYVVNEAAGSATITVQLNTPFAQTVFVDYATTDGTAMSPTDYLEAGGTLIFPAGETNKTFRITIYNDSVKETNETVLLSLTSLNNATPGRFTTATLTIVDDGPPKLGAGSWQTNTGFRATLSGPPGRNYAIETKDSLSNSVPWLEITRVTNTTGTVDFTDPAAGGTKRFYRARQTN